MLISLLTLSTSGLFLWKKSTDKVRQGSPFSLSEEVYLQVDESLCKWFKHGVFGCVCVSQMKVWREVRSLSLRLWPSSTSPGLSSPIGWPCWITWCRTSAWWWLTWTTSTTTSAGSRSGPQRSLLIKHWGDCCGRHESWAGEMLLELG